MKIQGYELKRVGMELVITRQGVEIDRVPLDVMASGEYALCDAAYGLEAAIGWEAACDWIRAALDEMNPAPIEPIRK